MLYFTRVSNENVPRWDYNITFGTKEEAPMLHGMPQIAVAAIVSRDMNKSARSKVCGKDEL